MKVLRKMWELASSKRDEATAWLLIGAIFFAMRSCEYLATASEESKRTKVIRVKNITFKKGSKIVKHDDPNLDKSDLVRIRFEYQKNDKRDICVHMFRSGDKILCPVIAWAATVKRIRNIKDSSDDSKVCIFEEKSGKICEIRADYVRTKLRSIVDLLGMNELGFSKEDIGLHSIRSGGAMAMFLSGTSVIIIQRVGRWSSEAFLEYIRDQVESFTVGVSKNMVLFEEFFNLDNGEKHPDESLFHRSVEPEQNNIDIHKSVDGLDSIPFSIDFSRLAMN